MRREAGMRAKRGVALWGVAVVAMAAAVGPASAAAVAQRCTGPASTTQAGAATLCPGVNAFAARQTMVLKVHVAQCAPGSGTVPPAPPTESTGTLKTSVTTVAAQTCAFINAAHSTRSTGAITWKDMTTSSVTLTYGFTGTTRLINVTGTVTAGVFAGHSVTGQFRYKPVVSPNGKTLTQACANKVAAGKPGRISVVSLTLFRTKDFVIL
jgi:hypothetical protein